MPKSKASVEGDDHLHELQLLKKDVEENQHELSAIRAELSSVSSKQDQFHQSFNGIQHAVVDLGIQMTSMAQTLQSLCLNSRKQTVPSASARPIDDAQFQHSPGTADHATLQQKRLKVEALRRQYVAEHELSRLYQQNLPATRRSAPPGYGPIQAGPSQQQPDATGQAPHGRNEPPHSDQRNSWNKYTKDYEQDM
jgi:hypothetical protein